MTKVLMTDTFTLLNVAHITKLYAAPHSVALAVVAELYALDDIEVQEWVVLAAQAGASAPTYVTSFDSQDRAVQFIDWAMDQWVNDYERVIRTDKFLERWEEE